MLKRISCLLLALTLSVFAFASCSLPQFSGGESDGASVISEEEEQYQEFRADETGIITATSENTRMLGRTCMGVFRSYDAEAKVTNKRENVLFFNWPASGFQITFVGTGLEVEFCSKLGKSTKSSDHIFLYVIIDGQDDPDTCPKLEINQSVGFYTICDNLPEGEHTVKFVRKNSNDMGGNSLTGVASYKVHNGDGEGYMINPPKLRDRKIEAFGDSITCGDELWNNDNGTTSSDGWRTYAGYVARKLDAELNVVAISGNGLICSLFGTPLYEIPDRFQKADEYNGGNVQWDFSKYQSDVVLINLGTNDCAGVPNNYSYEMFEQAYVDFCTEIKTAYPNCIIIAMLGMMGGRGKVWPSIENAATRINETYGDGTMYTLWLEVEGISDSPVPGGAHPSIAAQEKAGEMIVDIITASKGWTRKN